MFLLVFVCKWCAALFDAAAGCRDGAAGAAVSPGSFQCIPGGFNKCCQRDGVIFAAGVQQDDVARRKSAAHPPPTLSSGRLKS